jgi:hypothetical protein
MSRRASAIAIMATLGMASAACSKGQSRDAAGGGSGGQAGSAHSGGLAQSGAGGTGGSAGLGGSTGGGLGGHAGSVNAGGLAESGAGGTDAGAGQAGSAGSAGQGGTVVVPPTHAFEVTIENGLSETLFVDAMLLPFELYLDGAILNLHSWCPCTRCGTGNSCPSTDPMALAAELPAGDSLTVTAELVWYTHTSVSAQSCPEASFRGTCGDPHSFQAGSYEIVVPYDDLAAMTLQGLEPFGWTRWGCAVWEGSPIGRVYLSSEARQSFELTGDSSSITVTITDQGG